MPPFPSATCTCSHPYLRPGCPLATCLRHNPACPPPHHRPAPLSGRLGRASACARQRRQRPPRAGLRPAAGDRRAAEPATRRGRHPCSRPRCHACSRAGLQGRGDVCHARRLRDAGAARRRATQAARAAEAACAATRESHGEAGCSLVFDAAERGTLLAVEMAPADQGRPRCGARWLWHCRPALILSTFRARSTAPLPCSRLPIFAFARRGATFLAPCCPFHAAPRSERMAAFSMHMVFSSVA